MHPQKGCIAEQLSHTPEEEIFFSCSRLYELYLKGLDPVEVYFMSDFSCIDYSSSSISAEDSIAQNLHHN